MSIGFKVDSSDSNREILTLRGRARLFGSRLERLRSALPDHL